MRSSLQRRPQWIVFTIAALIIAMAITACSDGSSQDSTDTPSPTPAEPATTVDADAVVLSWTREGGIAGFCDGLRLTAGHLVSRSRCDDPPMGQPAGDLAPSSFIREFEAWRTRFASFEVEWGDGDAVADGMTVRLSFLGRGSQIADDETQRAIADFAGRLFSEIGAVQPRA